MGIERERGFGGGQIGMVGFGTYHGSGDDGFVGGMVMGGLLVSGVGYGSTV